MKLWRIRVEDKESAAEKAYLAAPGRTTALRWYGRERTKEKATWTPLAVLGYYVDQYERFYHRRWQVDGVAALGAYNDAVLLCEREGVEYAVAAIEAVFGKELRWVDNKMSFLTNKRTFTTHVVPVVHKRMTSLTGEQSEWRSQSNIPGRRRVSAKDAMRGRA